MSLRPNTPMPDLAGVTEWRNTRPADLRLAGRPALIYLWSVSCSICHEHMPKLADWRSLYGPGGLRLVAIHVPRQEQNTNVAGVRAAIEALAIHDPCGVDNHHAIKAAFAATYLPAYFLFDHEGRLRARAGGEAGLSLLERPLRRLFQQEGIAPAVTSAPGYLTIGLQ